MPNHNHNWSDCPNNPRSKQYKGVHYKEIWKKQNSKEKEVQLNIKETETSSSETVKFADIVGYESEEEEFYMTESKITPWYILKQ